MTTTTRATAVGVFADPADAERAVHDLQRAGFPAEQIGLLTQHGRQETAVHADVEAERGAAVGGVTGGVVGSLLGAGVALTLPGIGPALAIGVLAGLLTGGTLGIMGGGLLGALMGMGVPEDEAHYYQRQLEAGRALVTVHTDGRYAEALEILRRNGAEEAHSPMSYAGTSRLP